MAKTVSFKFADKRAKDYEIMLEFDEDSGAVDEIVLLDPLKDTIVQVLASGNTWDLETTSNTGVGNTDLENAAVPWILLKNQITADFHTGAAMDNRGLVGVKFTVSAITTNFKIFVAQFKLDEREG